MSRYSALRAHTVMGRSYVAGDTVDVSDVKPSTVQKMVAWKRIALVPDAPAAKPKARRGPKHA